MLCSSQLALLVGDAGRTPNDRLAGEGPAAGFNLNPGAKTWHEMHGMHEMRRDGTRAVCCENPRSCRVRLNGSALQLTVQVSRREGAAV